MSAQYSRLPSSVSKAGSEEGRNLLTMPPGLEEVIKKMISEAERQLCSLHAVCVTPTMSGVISTSWRACLGGGETDESGGGFFQKSCGKPLILGLSQLDQVWETRRLRAFSEIQLGIYHAD